MMARTSRVLCLALLLGLLLVSQAACEMVPPAAAPAPAPVPGPAPAPVSMGDPIFDGILKSAGISYTEAPASFNSGISVAEAIARASNHAIDMAQKAKARSARLVLYGSAAEGISDRPVWLVTFKGVASPPRGGAGESASLPPVLITNVILDGVTGEVLSLESLGHR